MYPLVYVTLILIITTELHGLKCRLGRYHKVRKDGRERCKKCPACNAGEGWNTSVVIKTDAARGYLECPPCRRCPVGYYRPAKSVSQMCYECGLDCKRLNRYGSVKCGLDTPGHCGDCIPGYRPESSEANDLCRRQVVTYTTVTTLPFEHESSREPAPQMLHGPQIALIILGAATLLAVIIGVTIYLATHHRTPSTINVEVPSSEEVLLSNSSTPVSKHDLDIDGPTPVPARTEAMLPATRITSGNIVDRVIEKDDETLSIVSTQISGKTVQEFFHCLHIHSSKIDPHEELWEKHNISYPNYILNVLIEWTKSAQPKPNLISLCSALERASFDEVIDKILALPENQPT